MTIPNNDELRADFLGAKLVVTPKLVHIEGNISYVMLSDYPTMVTKFINLIVSHDQQLLEAILEGADYGVCTGGEWSNEKKQFVCDHDHSGIVPVEHIKSVFKKEGE